MKEKEVFERLLRKQVEPGPMRDQLKGMRVKATYGNCVLFQMVKRAAEGDLSAAKYVLGAIGDEGPEQEVYALDLSQLSTQDLKRMLVKREVEDHGA